MNHGHVDRDIAVIGTACRVAGANSPSELWEVLAKSKDVQSEITRFSINGFYHPEGGPRKGLTNVKDAYMMDDDSIGRFDNAFFFTTPAEAVAMDPQQRMLLEIAYEAMESAGIPLDDFVGTDTAVYAGMEGTDYHTVLARDLDATPRYLATGTATCMAANRISYFFNLSGPSLVVDTACSSSMAALHQAVRALQTNDAGMALVCGAKLIVNPDMFIPSTELGFLSPDGRCKSFDASGDGYGRGEGVLAILLKPLKHAIRDADPIRAVVKGTRLNQDGRTQGITLPSAEAQKSNMQSLYKELEISPDKIQYVEAHGTGTAAGDPLEISAINSVFGPSRKGKELVVGSVKSNIGHLESASALAAIIKTIGCLERGKIPRQMHFVNPNPKIDFTNIQIPQVLMDWPESRDDIRRAGINTFGAGGTNGHAVLEAYLQAPSHSIEPEIPFLFKVSAADENSLRRLSLKYADYVEKQKPCLRDLAHTLVARRSTLKYSVFFVTRSHSEIVDKLRSETRQIHRKGPEGAKKVAFVFTGQGAQWAQMGKDLIEHFPMFKATLLECESILSRLPDGPSWSIVKELSNLKGSSRIYEAEYAQPLCTALQLALVVILQILGVEPVAVVGHSSGEIAAAFAAGLITLRDAIVIAYYRGLYVAKCTLGKSMGRSKGFMCAVSLSEADAGLLLDDFKDRAQLAAINSPTSCTISGDEDAIGEIFAVCSEKGVFNRKLRVDTAYHSHHMLPVACQYEEALAKAKVLSSSPMPSCSMFSTVTGRKLPPERLTPAYWAQNLTSTVLFAPSFTECLKHHPETNAILEIGPHPALKGPLKEILTSVGKSQIEYFHTCIREQSTLDTFLLSTGVMISYGISLNAAKINARQATHSPDMRFDYGNVLTDLPSYQWDHSTSFWAESRVSRVVRYRQFPRHALLGSRYIDDIPMRPCWRNQLMLKEVPWLMEIKNCGIKSLPATVYILMALEAARQLYNTAKANGSFLHLTYIVFHEPLSFNLFTTPDSTIEVQTTSRKLDDTDDFEFEIFSQTSDQTDSWTKHCSGIFGWTDHHISNSAQRNIGHDPDLWEKSLTLRNHIAPELHVSRISPQGSTGYFEASIGDFENHSVAPTTLDSILHLPPILMLGKNLPAEYSLQLVECISVPISTRSTSSGKFAIAVEPTYPYGVEANIEISQGDLRMFFGKVKYGVDNLLAIEPARSSLFFKPTLLPDISRINSTKTISLSECTKLITHKWPMSNIKILGVSEAVVGKILDTLRVGQPEVRPQFQSLQILGKSKGSSHMSNGVRFAESLDPGPEAQLIFSSGQLSAKEILLQLRPDGLACLCGMDEVNMNDLSKAMEMITGIADIDEEEWSLWRMKNSETSAYNGRKTIVFSASERNEASAIDLPEVEYVKLQPSAIEDFCKRIDATRYDAIILDNTEESVIAAWHGQDLLPWLQNLLYSTDSILWVTQDVSCSPFNELAGTLLRTIQSEQPFLKVTWLVFKNAEKESMQSIQKHIFSAYESMLLGENENKLEVEDSQVKILRYLPDDELSTTTGLVLPRMVDPPLGKQDYKLSLAAPREAVILSSYPNATKPSGEGLVSITVEASVVDINDVLRFSGASGVDTASPDFGTFFAGRKRSGGDNQPSLEVVGWHPGSHCKHLEVPMKRLCEYSETDPALAAAEFAAIATAICIAEGVTRIREGDTFSLDKEVILNEALEFVCAQRRASLLEPGSGLIADFAICLDPSRGLLVNDRPVNIARYLDSDRGCDVVAETWNSYQKLQSRFQSCLYKFCLSAYKEAFEIAASNPYSTILTHSNVDTMEKHVPIHKQPKNLFSPTGAYILVGGLGGLGRFVCRWLISYGARTLISISRSGINSPEAQEINKYINNGFSDASLQVVKADATNRPIIADIFDKIREKTPIRGVINMAMILGDASLASMTGEEWDRVLHVKINSSWILHEETLQDNLDFFLLFSSIASVLGNRNQANYNVANTFLNALASYRHSLRMPAVSIALGAMVDIGVLHDLNNPALLPTLTRSGLTHLDSSHLAKILEAAVQESKRFERSLIVTGLGMFERVDGKVQGRGDPLFWTELPEFAHLSTYRLSSTGEGAGKERSLRERIEAAQDAEGRKDISTEAFKTFLSGLLGFPESTFSDTNKLAMYGLDSLSAVSCQYWLFRELNANISVGEILGGLSIAEIIGKVLETLEA